MSATRSSRRSVTFSSSGGGGSSGGGTVFSSGGGGSGYSASGGGSSSFSGGGGGASYSASGGSSGFSSGSSSSFSASGGSASFAASGADGVGSPTSPTRLTRRDEKEQLSGLNDRLANYMDRVRQLENENRALSFQIRTQEETVVKDRANIRGAYDQELADARRVLDETAKDRARLQIEVGKFRTKIEDLEAKLAKAFRDLKDSDGRRLFAESQVQDLQAKANSAENERRHFEEENKKLLREIADLRKQLELARKQLEDETLLRVDFENRYQSLREEMDFNKSIYQQELEESRHKRQTEIVQVNTALEDEYQQKLQDGLKAMREDFDIQLRMSRKDFEEMYERKMMEIRDDAERKMSAAGGLRDESKKLRMQLETAMKDRDRFEGLVSDLEKKIRDLEFELQNERDGFYSRLTSREDEIRRLKAEIGDMMQEYQDLMDTKIQLDVEIAAYRKLLEAEESRLHLTPGGSAIVTKTTSSSSSSSSSKFGSGGGSASVQRGAKRKRMIGSSLVGGGGDSSNITTTTRAEVLYGGGTTNGREEDSRFTYSTSQHCEGAIEIADHDTDGTYVKLHNRSDEDVSVGGWQVKRISGDDEVIYKFHRSLVVKAGKTATVWSSNSEVTHSPPTDLLMRNQQWPVGDNIRSVLVNADDQEVAWRESTRNASSSATSRYSYRTSGEPEFSTYSSRVGSASSASYGDADNSERCSLM